jgi:hypothetical protein
MSFPSTIPKLCMVDMGLLGIVAFAAIQLVNVRSARLLQLNPVKFRAG